MKQSLKFLNINFETWIVHPFTIHGNFYSMESNRIELKSYFVKQKCIGFSTIWSSVNVFKGGKTNNTFETKTKMPVVVGWILIKGSWKLMVLQVAIIGNSSSQRKTSGRLKKKPMSTIQGFIHKSQSLKMLSQWYTENQRTLTTTYRV